MQNKIKVFTGKPTIKKELRQNIERAIKNREECTIYVEYEEVNMWNDHYEWNVQAILYVENDYIHTWTWKELIGLTTEEWLDDYSEYLLYKDTLSLFDYLCEHLGDYGDWVNIILHQTMQRA